MKIEWNRVTWYSKILTIVVFIATFWIGFTIGSYWQWAVDLNDLYKVHIEKLTAAAPHAADQFAGWKTYRNDAYGFEFKYPPAFSYAPSAETAPTGSVWLGHVSAPQRGDLGVSVKEQPLDPNSIKGIYVTYKKGDSALRILSVGGKEAYSYREGDEGCGGDVVNIPNRDKTIVMAFGSCEGDHDSIEVEMNDILSTVKLF